jgi:hypothetical protein
MTTPDEVLEITGAVDCRPQSALSDGSGGGEGVFAYERGLDGQGSAGRAESRGCQSSAARKSRIERRHRGPSYERAGGDTISIRKPDSFTAIPAKFLSSVKWRCPYWAHHARAVVDACRKHPGRHFLTQPIQSTGRTEEWHMIVVYSGSEADYPGQAGAGPVCRCRREPVGPNPRTAPVLETRKPHRFAGAGRRHNLRTRGAREAGSAEGPPALRQRHVSCKKVKSRGEPWTSHYDRIITTSHVTIDDRANLDRMMTQIAAATTSRC